MRQHLTERFVERLRPTGKALRVFDTNWGKGGGLVLGVSPKGTKAWYALHYPDEASGKARYAKLGNYPVLNLQQATTAAKKFLANPKAALRHSAADSFKVVAQNYIDREVKGQLRTEAESQRMLDRYVFPVIGERRITDVGRSDVTKLIDGIAAEIARRQSGKERDPTAPKPRDGRRQAERVRGIIRMICEWHEDRADGHVSPVARRTKRRKKGAPSKRSRVLADAEIRAVWRASRKMGTYGALVRFALLTMQRREKLVALRRSDIRDRVWKLTKEDGEKGNIGSVRLPKLATAIVDGQPKIDGSAFVFPSLGKPNKPFNAWSKSKRELDALVRETLPGMPHWTFHDLRRTGRTLLPRVGFDGEIAERVMGHQIGGVEGNYNWWSYFDEKSAALAKLADLIESIVGERNSVRRFVA